MEAISARQHESVMAERLTAALSPRAGGLYLDGTFGGGGHSRAILQAAEGCRVLALDRDASAAPRAHLLAAAYPGRFHFVCARFSRLDAVAAEAGFTPLDGVALDLGLSSIQLDDPARGFSHDREGPLDMTMEREGEHGAGRVAEMLAEIAPEALEEIIRIEGEEPQARRVARAIVRARDTKGICTTLELAHAIAPTRTPLARKRLARVFQALRRHINQEAEELERGLLAAARALGEGGRCVVISFHSLEDRVVKQAFAVGEGRPFRAIEPALARPSAQEVEHNPRARSARMRAAQRTAAPAPEAPYWRAA